MWGDMIPGGLIRHSFREEVLVRCLICTCRYDSGNVCFVKLCYQMQLYETKKRLLCSRGDRTSREKEREVYSAAMSTVLINT